MSGNFPSGGRYKLASSNLYVHVLVSGEHFILLRDKHCRHIISEPSVPLFIEEFRKLKPSAKQWRKLYEQFTTKNLEDTLEEKNWEWPTVNILEQKEEEEDATNKNSNTKIISHEDFYKNVWNEFKIYANAYITKHPNIKKSSKRKKKTISNTNNSKETNTNNSKKTNQESENVLCTPIHQNQQKPTRKYNTRSACKTLSFNKQSLPQIPRAPMTATTSATTSTTTSATTSTTSSATSTTSLPQIPRAPMTATTSATTSTTTSATTSTTSSATSTTLLPQIPQIAPKILSTTSSTVHIDRNLSFAVNNIILAINNLGHHLSNRIDSIETNLGERIDNLDHKMDTLESFITGQNKSIEFDQYSTNKKLKTKEYNRTYYKNKTKALNPNTISTPKYDFNDLSHRQQQRRYQNTNAILHQQLGSDLEGFDGYVQHSKKHTTDIFEKLINNKILKTYITAEQIKLQNAKYGSLEYIYHEIFIMIESIMSASIYNWQKQEREKVRGYVYNEETERYILSRPHKRDNTPAIMVDVKKFYDIA
eukprot:477099_1